MAAFMGLISPASLTPAFTEAQATCNVFRRITGSSVQTVRLVAIVSRWSGMWVLFPGDGAERARAVLSVWNSISLPNSCLSPSEANSHLGRRDTWGEEYCSCAGYLARQETWHKEGELGLYVSILFLPLSICFSGSPQLSEKHKHVRENSCLSPRERPCSAVFPNPLDPTQVDILAYIFIHPQLQNIYCKTLDPILHILWIYFVPIIIFINYKTSVQCLDCPLLFVTYKITICVVCIGTLWGQTITFLSCTAMYTAICQFYSTPPIIWTGATTGPPLTRFALFIVQQWYWCGSFQIVPFVPMWVYLVSLLGYCWDESKNIHQTVVPWSETDTDEG